MIIKEFRVEGFQSFGDTGALALKSGINLIVGQNNVGKSALLRALTPAIVDDRHHSSDNWEDVRLARPKTTMVVETSGRELEDALFGSGQINLPVPDGVNGEAFVGQVFDGLKRPVWIERTAGGSTLASLEGLDFSAEMAPRRTCIQVHASNGMRIARAQQVHTSSLGALVQRVWERKLFYFSAERMNVGKCALSRTLSLSANADNLPAVLQTLEGERGDAFDTIVALLRRIFPTVGNISVRPVPNGPEVEIRVWPTEARPRLEQSFPLLHSGTGVAQVLAILTALSTVDNAVVVIDEINSFLHPAAVKSLLRMIQTEFSEHQYIISTHSPDVISFSNPGSIHLVRREGYESTVECLKVGDVEAMRDVADHLGVSMSDVFAAERVIWVEGPTEELCFPYLYQQMTGSAVPRGTIITSVVSTGSLLRKRDRDLVFEIYERLSSAAQPLVKAVVFSFDSETLSDTDKEDMVRRSGNKMHFLPRRHIECYLINAAALAAFIAERDDPEAAPIDEEAVCAAMMELAADRAFMKGCTWTGDLENVDWQANVDAANLFNATCQKVSEERVTFGKNGDTLALLQLVEKTNPAQLDDLKAYVKELVDAVGE